METPTNLRWHLNDEGVPTPTVPSQKKLKLAQVKATALIARSTDNLLGCMCWRCNEAGRVFLKQEHQYRDKALYCHGCGRYYFDRIDITDYDLEPNTPPHEQPGTPS